MEGFTLAGLITQVSALVTGAVGWMGDFVDAITSNTVLTVFCIVLPLVGLGAGLLARLIRVRF